MSKFGQYTEEDFDSLNDTVLSKSELKSDCSGCQTVKELLLRSQEFKEVVEYTTRACGNEFNSHQECVTVFSELIFNTFEDIYVALRHQQYISGYRSVRYLYESFLILKGLNKDRERSKELYNTFVVELDSLVNGPKYWPQFPYKHRGEIGSLLSSEKDNLENKDENIKELYTELSDQANHPCRLEKAYTQGEHNPSLELDISALSLWLYVGIVCEYLRTFENTHVNSEHTDLLKQRCQKQTDLLPGGPPTFLEEYYGSVL